VGVLDAGTKRRDDGQHDCVLADKELHMPGVLPAELGGLIERGGLKPRSVVRLRDYIVDGPITARWAGLARTPRPALRRRSELLLKQVVARRVIQVTGLEVLGVLTLAETPSVP